MDFSNSQQWAEQSSGMEEDVKFQSSESTSCVQINETPSSSEAGNVELYICSRCADIDFLSNFPPPTPPNHVTLQRLDQDDPGPECGVCPLLRAPSLDFPNFRHCPYFLRSWTDSDCGYNIPQTYHVRQIIISPAPHGKIEGNIQYDPPVSVIEIPFHASSSFTAAKIDFSVLKFWIEGCSHHHGLQCEETWEHDRIHGLKLIKIKERRIINASQEGGPYAALSYVWGTGPQASPQGDKLPADIPKTIVDAMNVALELELDYLWVDRYCIQQDDTEDKKHQISKMHHIYQAAQVTIIAAAGNGPDHGIPGISIPRTPPPHLLLGDRLFARVRGSEELLIAPVMSKWATRAWTYQEEVLSKRILCFTDSDVLFYCNQTHFCAIEEPLGNLARTESHRRSRTKSEDLVWKKNRMPDWSADLRFLIGNIGRRDITYESDRVNTIAGVLGYLKEKGVIEGHLSGSPIFSKGVGDKAPKNWEEGFLSGLACYHYDASAGRRKEFPSWSWAGWNLTRSSDDHPFVRDDNIRIWIEIDTATTSIISSVDGMPKPLVSDCSRICLPSGEFQEVLPRLIFENSTCRFIRIEAPILHCQLEQREGYWRVATAEGYQIQWSGPTSLKLGLLEVQTDYYMGYSSQSFQLMDYLESDHVKGIFMQMSDGNPLVIFVRKVGDCFERVMSWQPDYGTFPFTPYSQEESGSIIPLLNESKWQPGSEVRLLLKKEIIRLG